MSGKPRKPKGSKSAPKSKRAMKRVRRAPLRQPGSENQYRYLFESMADAFCIIEVIFEGERAVDYRFLQVNAAFERHSGITHAVGRRVRELMPDLDEHWFEIYGQVAKSGKPVRFENVARPVRRYYEVNALPMGEPGHHQVAVLFKDVTERKRYEANLAFLNDVSQELAKVTSFEATMTALGAKIVSNFRASQCVFGEVNEGQQLITITHEVEHAKALGLKGVHRISDFLNEDFRRASRAGEPYVVRDTMNDSRANAEQMAMLSIGAFVSVPIAEGGEWRFIFAVVDSSPRDWREDEVELMKELTTRIWARLERARAEAAMRESEERFRALVNASSDALYRMNSDWTEMRHLVGRDFIADTFEPSRAWLQKYIPHEDQPQLLAVIKEAIRTKSIFELEHRILRVDGSVGWTFSRAVPLLDSIGEIIEWFGAATDITDRKRSEEALRDANIKLQQADQRKNEFIAMLSHELRNPLAPIRNGLYVLDLVPKEAEQARRAKAIVDRQVGHLSRLVDDLLDVSRVTRGKVLLQRQRLDLCELVRSTVEDHRSAFVESDIALEVSTPHSAIWVDGDETRLSQVLGNMLQNAAKFTPPKGTTSVKVATDEANHQAVISVQDSGRGIAPELLPRMFEPFHQADLTLDRKLGGLGLGLSLVKGLVEMHGGSVSVASHGRGQGAIFTITLPLGKLRSSESNRSGMDNAAGKLRVLVIEDNEDAAESLKAALQLWGHNVEIAMTGQEGLAKARAFRPEVILCDIGLPQMNGYEVARALRVDSELARARLVALTGYASSEEIAKAKEAGFDSHLAKPASMEAVKNMLRNA